MNLFPDVFFLPSVEKRYGEGRFWDRRVMILGGSTHCKRAMLESWGDRYQDCIHTGHCLQIRRPGCCGYIHSNRDGFVHSVSRYVVQLVAGIGKEQDISSETQDDVWDSIISTNYLQEALSDGQVRGTAAQHHRSEAAFFEELEAFRPELVICFGVSDLWYKMPNVHFEPQEAFSYQGITIQNGISAIASSEVRALPLWMPHPSAREAVDPVFRHGMIMEFCTTH